MVNDSGETGSSSSSSLFPSMGNNDGDEDVLDHINDRNSINDSVIDNQNITNHIAKEEIDVPEMGSIHSSVLHRMLDNETFYGADDNDKVRLSKMYNKYSNTKHNLEFTDFDTYNRILLREEVLRGKLDNLAQRKARNVEHGRMSNALPTFDEYELNEMYVGGSVDERRTGNNGRSNKIFNLLRGVKSRDSEYKAERNNRNETENDKEKEKEKHFYEDYVSTFSSIPIDDDIRIEDLPIDYQPFRKMNRDLEFNSNGNGNGNGNGNISYNNHKHDFDDDIDIVVSGQDKLDYDFHRIELYKDIDPEHRDSNIPKSSNKCMKFLLMLIDRLNIFKMIRIQRANKYQIQRKLNLRHLHQIALGGTLGVGLLLSSGKAFSIAGPFGCLIGFVIGAFIVIATMLSFCEIVTLIPLCGGVSGIASRFVDDAFGFSLGVVYWITYTVSLPTEITAASIMLSFYSNLNIPGASTAGWITLFICFTIMLNLFDIRVYGEFEYYSTIIKLLILLALMLYMIIMNRGGAGPEHQVIGFKYWDSHLSDISEHLTFGLFRPTFDVADKGMGALNGIGGNLGRFLQILMASVIACYAYVGTEIVILAGSESRNPRESIPSATKNIYIRIVVFYLVAIFLVGLNIYSGDPRLLRYFSSERDTRSPDELIKLQNEVIEHLGTGRCSNEIITWAGFSNGNQSPWIIAIQSTGLCSFAAVVNAFLIYFALTAASSQLYASSRTLYFMSIQNKAPKIFSVCTKRGVPYMSVLFTGSFGLLSYLSVQKDTALIFERLVSVCASAGLLVWSGMCLSFIRFYYALRLRPDIISRNDVDYPYRSPFQPYLAVAGLFLSLFLVFASGFVVFLHGDWSPLFFISSYGCVFLFILCYLGWWILRRSKIERLDQIDLDSGRREIDRVIWEDERYYASNFKEIIQRGVNLLI